MNQSYNEVLQALKAQNEALQGGLARITNDINTSAEQAIKRDQIQMQHNANLMNSWNSQEMMKRAQYVEEYANRKDLSEAQKQKLVNEHLAQDRAKFLQEGGYSNDKNIDLATIIAGGIGKAVEKAKEWGQKGIEKGKEVVEKVKEATKTEQEKLQEKANNAKPIDEITAEATGKDPIQAKANKEALEAHKTRQENLAKATQDKINNINPYKTDIGTIEGAKKALEPQNELLNYKPDYTKHLGTSDNLPSNSGQSVAQSKLSR